MAVNDRIPPPLPEQSGIRFRPIEGFPGYCVSDDGRVWSCVKPCRYYAAYRPSWKVLKTSLDIHGRPWLSLIANRVETRRHLHTLVAIAFHGKRPMDKECCHNDGNKLNNRADNLRWDTCKANCADQIKHGTRPRGSTHGNAVMTEAIVKAMRAEMRSGGTTYEKLAKKYGFGMSTVFAAVTGLTWTHVDEPPVPGKIQARKRGVS